MELKIEIEPILLIRLVNAAVEGHFSNGLKMKDDMVELTQKLRKLALDELNKKSDKDE